MEQEKPKLNKKKFASPKKEECDIIEDFTEVIYTSPQNMPRKGLGNIFRLAKQIDTLERSHAKDLEKEKQERK